MALIEITVDHPSLISTGEDQQRTTDREGGVLPDDEDGHQGSDEGETETTDDGLGDTLKTVSTILTAVTTLAGVLKRLRSEDEGTLEGEADSLFDEEVTEDAGDAEAESFVESVVGDEADANEGAEDLEAEADDEDEAADDSGHGLGLTVAFVLVVVLIALALRARGGDEESVDDDWD